MIVEVCHPSVSVALCTKAMGKGIDFVCGSPTCFSDEAFERSVRACALQDSSGSCYVPVGALWGASDLQALSNRDGLAELAITMKKHPAMIKVTDDKLNAVRQRLCASHDAGKPEGPVELFRGSVRELCPLAPNNVNTMACAAMAAHSVGFDKTVGVLVADSNLTTHEVEYEALGKLNPTTGKIRDDHFGDR